SLTWRDNSDNETGFELQRSINNQAFELVAMLPVNSTTYTDQTPAEFSSARYRVRAFRDDQQSEFSAIAAASVSNILPRAIENFSAQVIGSNVSLQWTDKMKIVVLGSSTAAGVGASSSENSWVGLFASWVQSLKSDAEVINLGKGGFTTYDIRTAGSMPAPDLSRNIDAAIAHDPDIVIINLPSNNVADNVPSDVTLSHFQELKILAETNGIKLFVTTTQPRNFSNESKRQKLQYEASAMMDQFGNLTINVYDELVNLPDLGLKASYDSGDGTHLNDAGHNYMFTAIRDHVRTFVDMPVVVSKSIGNKSNFTPLTTLTIADAGYTDSDVVLNVPQYYTITKSNPDGEIMSETDITIDAPVSPDVSLTHKPQYNGNISAIKWKSIGDEEEKLYSYHYDPLNRIKAAEYAQGTSSSNSWASKVGGFSLHSVNYDLNGNIISLNRQDGTSIVRTIDKLTYTYKKGNQLSAVSDDAAWEGFADGSRTGDDYKYDSNGNMIEDKNKGITITYNHLNLPERVEKDANNYIEYIYDANGNKLAQITYEEGKAPKKTEYIGELIYENDELQLIQHEEGRIVEDKTTGTFEYQYHLKDHLGNTRLTFTTKPTTTTFSVNYERDSYYPDDISLFENVENISSVADFNHTDGLYGGPLAKGKYTHSQVLYSSPYPQVGSVLAIPVGAGDNITARVYAKYMDNTANPDVAVNTLASALIGAFTGGVPGAGESGTSNINHNFGSESLIGGADFPFEDTGAPKAFLNVMFLPEDGVIDLVKGATFAYDQIDKGSVEIVIDGNSKDPFDELKVENFEVSQNGYILIYLSNEGSLTDIYFDDLEIELNETPVIQSDDYYPFGLQFNSYQRITAKENKWRFQGQEHIDDLGLNWDSFKWRNHQPDIGRFFSVDPLAENFYYNSTYAFAENRVTSGVEIEGLEWAPPLIPNSQGKLVPNVKMTSEMTKGIVPLVEVKASYGWQFGVKAGKFGGEVNFGSKEIGTVSEEGFVLGDDNKVTKGISLAYGAGEIGLETETTTEMSDIQVEILEGTSVYKSATMETETTKAKASVTLFGFGPESTKTKVEKSVDGVKVSRTESPREVNMKGEQSGMPTVIKETKFSIAIGLKIQLGFKE
ncbi:GDSL-type esterase/lipase family protein, partial [Fulvivirga kasyanovii]